MSDKTDRKGRARFVYRPRTYEDVRQQMGDVFMLTGPVLKRRDPEPLCDYLESDASLTEKDRWALSNLIRRLVENLPPRRGRPRGSRLLDPVRAAEYTAAQLVLDARSQLRRREGRKRLPRTRRHEGEKTIQAELINEMVKHVVQQWCPELKCKLLDEHDKVTDRAVANVERIIDA